MIFTYCQEFSKKNKPADLSADLIKII